MLEVDHIRPRSDGGTDAYGNLSVLCAPCNEEKRDFFTLTCLQNFNRKNGYVKSEANRRLGRAARRSKRRRR